REWAEAALPLLERHHHRRPPLAAPAVRGDGTQDREQPGLRVRAQGEVVESAIGPQERFLHELESVFGPARDPQCRRVDGPREGQGRRSELLDAPLVGHPLPHRPKRRRAALHSLTYRSRAGTLVRPSVLRERGAGYRAAERALRSSISGRGAFMKATRIVASA